MTFMQVLLLIQDRGETIVSDKTHAIQTDKFLYSRSTTGEWEQRDLPLPIEEHHFPPLPETPAVEKKKKKK